MIVLGNLSDVPGVIKKTDCGSLRSSPLRGWLIFCCKPSINEPPPLSLDSNDFQLSHP